MFTFQASQLFSFRALSTAIAAGYAVVASLVFTWLRRSSFAGSRLLAIGSAVFAVLGASAWIQQLLVRTFQDGLGYSQTPLPIQALDLVANSGGSGVLAVLGVLALIAGLLMLWNLSQSTGTAGTVQVVATAPFVAALVATLIAPLFVGTYGLGKEIRAGNLAHADGIAACVQLGTTSNEALPDDLRRTSVLVGPVTGPAVLIYPSGDTPVMTALPGGVTARLEPASETCPAANSQPTK